MENTILFPKTEAFNTERIATQTSHKMNVEQVTAQNTQPSIYNRFLSEFESKRMGYGTAGLFVQSCLGGIAAMVILANDTSSSLQMIELFIVTLVAMSYNGSFMINLKVKTVFNLLISSVLICIFMIVFNLL